MCVRECVRLAEETEENNINEFKKVSCFFSCNYFAFFRLRKFRVFVSGLLAKCMPAALKLILSWALLPSVLSPDRRSAANENFKFSFSVFRSFRHRVYYLILLINELKWNNCKRSKWMNECMKKTKKKIVNKICKNCERKQETT